MVLRKLPGRNIFGDQKNYVKKESGMGKEMHYLKASGPEIANSLGNYIVCQRWTRLLFQKQEKPTELGLSPGTGPHPAQDCGTLSPSCLILHITENCHLNF